MFINTGESVRQDERDANKERKERNFVIVVHEYTMKFVVNTPIIILFNECSPT